MKTQTFSRPTPPPTPITPEDLKTLSDSQLYSRAREYGVNARAWKRKFAGLLPEIYHRRLYKRRGFASIYEFAFKLAGMSERSVDKVINLSRRLEDMPAIKQRLEDGSQGWSKIEIVASIAQPETDKKWAEKVDRLSFRALRAYVIECKRGEEEKNKEITESEEGMVSLFTNDKNQSYLTGAGHGENNCQWSQMHFQVKREVEFKLRSLKQDLGKEKKEAQTFNDVMEHLLDGDGSKIGEDIATIQVCPKCAKKKGCEAKTRHIPVQVKRYVRAKHKGKCAFRCCNMPATNLHHTKRYALNHNHDPDLIAPLCEEHERLVHAGLVVNEEASPGEWRVQDQPDIQDPKFAIDQAVQKRRQEC